MTDQIHTVDGSTEADREVTDAAAREPDESVESALATVLQFPRDWFGPIEDLGPVYLDPATVSPVSAAAFWDEDAGDVHQLVELPDGESFYDEQLPDRAAEPHSVKSPGPERRSSEGDANPSTGSWNRRAGFVLIGLLALVVAGCAAVLASGTLHHRTAVSTLAQSRSRHTAVSQAPAPTVTAPAVTVTTTVTTARTSRTPRHKPTRNVKSVSSAEAAKSASSPEPEQTVVTHTAAPVIRHQSESPVVHHPSGTPVIHQSETKVIHQSETKAVHHQSETPAASSAENSAASSGSACVQSPDSGCLP